MRRFGGKTGRLDANQKEIVKALREIGAQVEETNAVGGGFPDLAVGYQGRNFFIEVKDGSRPPSGRRLTPDEVKWHQNWRGQVAVAHTVDEAIQIVRMSPKVEQLVTKNEGV